MSWEARMRNDQIAWDLLESLIDGLEDVLDRNDLPPALVARARAALACEEQAEEEAALGLKPSVGFWTRFEIVRAALVAAERHLREAPRPEVNGNTDGTPQPMRREGEHRCNS